MLFFLGSGKERALLSPLLAPAPRSGLARLLVGRPRAGDRAAARMAQRRAAGGAALALVALCLLAAARGHAHHEETAHVAHAASSSSSSDASASGQAELAGEGVTLSWTLNGNESVTFRVASSHPSLCVPLARLRSGGLHSVGD
jgi:hypothetical protein